MLLGLLAVEFTGLEKTGRQGYQERAGFSWKWYHQLLFFKTERIQEIEKWTLER